MRALILTTLVASMVVATASQARDSAEDITTVKNVTFKDLDLNTPPGSGSFTGGSHRPLMLYADPIRLPSTMMTKA